MKNFFLSTPKKIYINLVVFTVVCIVGFILAPFFTGAIKYSMLSNSEYLDNQKRIDQSNKKHDYLFIVYDDFTAGEISHGNAVSKILRVAANIDSRDLIRIDYTSTDIMVLKSLVVYALETKKKVFINLSFIPKERLDYPVYKKILSELSCNRNIIITQAVGNKTKLKPPISKSKNINIHDFKSSIIESINHEVDTIKKYALDEHLTLMEQALLYQYSIVKPWVHIINSEYGKIDKREDQLKIFVANTINDVLEVKFKIIDKNEKERIVNFFMKDLKTFSYIALLQSADNHMKFVSAYTPFDSNCTNKYVGLDDKNCTSPLLHPCSIADTLSQFITKQKNGQLINSSCIDCPIDGLIENRIRNLGEFFDEDGKYFSGTSGAAPLELAKIYKKLYGIKSTNANNK